MRLHYEEDGLYQFDPPLTAVTLWFAMGGSLSDPEEISVKLHVKLGPCLSALVEADFGGLRLGGHGFWTPTERWSDVESASRLIKPRVVL